MFENRWMWGDQRHLLCYASCLPFAEAYLLPPPRKPRLLEPQTGRPFPRSTVGAWLWTLTFFRLWPFPREH